MSHSSEYSERLLAEALPPGSLAALKGSVDAYALAMAQTMDDDDLTVRMANVSKLIIAIDGIKHAAGQISDAARSALAAAMVETSCPGVRMPNHTVYASEGKRVVDVLDPAAVPAEFMRTPAPTPDLAAIASLLKSGASVNWAKFSDPRPPILTIRSNKR